VPAPAAIDRILPSAGCSIDIKNVFFILVTFFIFQTFFLFFKENFGGVQSGKQINKKHFQNNSNETDLRFMCRIELQALAGI